MALNPQAFARLKSQLLNTGLSQKDHPLYQVINQLIDNLQDTANELMAVTGGSSGGGGGLNAASYYTKDIEGGLPNSRQLLPGQGIEFLHAPNGRTVINSAIPFITDGENGEDGMPGPPGPMGPSGLPGSAGPFLGFDLEPELFTPYGDLGTVLTPTAFPYTPVWTGSTTNPTLGNGSLTGSYIRIGRVVFYSIVLTIGSTTTPATGFWFFTFPTPANFVSGSVCEMNDITVATYLGMAILSTSALLFVRACATGLIVSDTSPFVWGNTDEFRLRGIYIEA